MNTWTRSPPVTEATRASLEAAVREGFAGRPISKIEITPKQDYDGDEIIEVLVVLAFSDVPTNSDEKFTASRRAQLALFEAGDLRPLIIELRLAPGQPVGRFGRAR
jgi:hypothetical protein